MTKQIDTKIEQEEIVFFLKSLRPSSIPIQKVTTRYCVKAKHLKQRLAKRTERNYDPLEQRAIGKSRIHVIKSAYKIPLPCKKVSADAIQLCFRCDEGRLRRFDGDKKISEIIESGHWSYDSVKHSSKIIYFVTRDEETTSTNSSDLESAPPSQ